MFSPAQSKDRREHGELEMASMSTLSLAERNGKWTARLLLNYEI